ncbi:MAG TPA: hypothetical protein VMI75_04245 [Polyangiaceae bacterium]|nr:hypothetical protein [Polyangiaceae bacterium]
MLGAWACSIVNTFGDVLQSAPTDASMTDTGGMKDTGPTDARGDADAGSQETGPNFPDRGVIVISGRVADDAGNLQGVLTAIDPTDGHELPNAREMRNVPLVQYDGLRDYWFIIETDGQSLFPTPKDKAVLHVRTLDPVSGTWADLGSLQVPPPVFGLATVITDRIAYVGFDPLVDSASGTSFITLDTSDPGNPTIFTASTPLDIQPQGIIGTRSTSGKGGSVNMLESVQCPSDGGMSEDDAGDDGGDAGSGGIGGGFCLDFVHVAVPTNPVPVMLGFDLHLGPFFGRPAYGSYLGLPPSGAPQDVIAWSLPGGNPGSPGQTAIHTFTPTNLASVGSPISIQTSDGFFQPLAFAECLQQAILTATNEDLSVYAVPLASAGGSLAQAMTTHSGQAVYFEPYTNTVLSPFTQGENYVLDAFTLGGTSDKPTLLQRSTGWNPPADVRPEVLGIRRPLPLKCLTDAGM